MRMVRNIWQHVRAQITGIKRSLAGGKRFYRDAQHEQVKEIG